MPHGEMCPREQEDVRAWPRGPLGRGRVGGAGHSLPAALSLTCQLLTSTLYGRSNAHWAPQRSYEVDVVPIS